MCKDAEVWSNLSELKGIQHVWIKMKLERSQDPDHTEPTCPTERLGLCPEADF